MLSNNFFKVLTVVLATLSVVLARHVTGRTIAIKSPTKFCLLLPPVRGGTIAKYEHNAVAFCKYPYKAAPNDNYLPHGFIKSYHYVKNNYRNYVQVTGRIDREKYDLDHKDGGGQYDHKNVIGAKCLGYRYFVELVEPDVEYYCLRCCQRRSDCPIHKSTKGCKPAIVIHRHSIEWIHSNEDASEVEA
ncbi:hypothetical protein BGX27_001817 [Mortierella sp. AM989]|nr:hypothetical protein BGX27_001817 [Mortierella sp. AM989]